MDEGMIRPAIEPLAQFGVAGLMGALWVWERLHTRKREQQLSEAHERIGQQRQSLRAMVKLIRQNTHAIERFGAAQDRVGRLLEKIYEEHRGIVGWMGAEGPRGGRALGETVGDCRGDGGGCGRLYVPAGDHGADAGGTESDRGRDSDATGGPGAGSPGPGRAA